MCTATHHDNHDNNKLLPITKQNKMAYEYCEKGSYCFSADTVTSTGMDEFCLTDNVHESYRQDFSVMGTRIYYDNYSNGSIFASSGDPLLSTVRAIFSNTPQWSSGYQSNAGPMNRHVLTVDTNCDGSLDRMTGEMTIPFHYYNTGNTKHCYIGFSLLMAPDMDFEIIMNGEVLVSGSGALLTGNQLSMYHRFWHVVPATLLACDNLINFKITSVGLTPRIFGLVLYDNSFNEMLSAPSDNYLNVLVSTADLVENGMGPYYNTFCPTGYMVDENSPGSDCVQVDYTSCKCDCCNRYMVRRMGGRDSLAYLDCDGKSRILRDIQFGEQRMVCACKMVADMNEISLNEWVTTDNAFAITLVSECDPTCTDPEAVMEECLECGFTQISVGSTHTVAISGGTLFSWGSNSNGQLGLGYSGGNIYRPEPMLDPTGGAYDWVWVEAGDGSTFAINSEGRMFACGSTATPAGGDQLGLMDTVNDYDTLTPITTPMTFGWSKVWSKAKATIALNMSGEIFGTGHNGNYRLGLGDTSDKKEFTKIGMDADWLEVSLGLHHTLGLKVDSGIFSWGTNMTGNIQTNPLGLGVGNQQAKFPTPVDMSVMSYYVPYAYSPPVQISAGNFHSLLLTADGGIWGMGSNSFGQLDCQSCVNVDRSRPSPLDGGLTINPPTPIPGGYSTNTGFTFIKAVGDSSFAIAKDQELSFMPFTTSNGAYWFPEMSGRRIWGWGLNYGMNKRTLLQDDMADRGYMMAKNDWCNIWAGGMGDNHANSSLLTVFVRDGNGMVNTWGDNVTWQSGVGAHPFCTNCTLNYIPPMGIWFNVPDPECHLNKCDCKEVRISNHSNSEVSFSYVNCSGKLIHDMVMPGGMYPTTKKVCFCPDTLSIDHEYYSPALIIITSNNNNCHD